jgi:hypothetical protein
MRHSTTRPRHRQISGPHGAGRVRSAADRPVRTVARGPVVTLGRGDAVDDNRAHEHEAADPVNDAEVVRPSWSVV